jgi:hypothetical protein
MLVKVDYQACGTARIHMSFGAPAIKSAPGTTAQYNKIRPHQPAINLGHQLYLSEIFTSAYPLVQAQTGHYPTLL